MTDDFSEEFYLKAYPDVERAVLHGAFTSGKQHYERYGKKEGRWPRNPQPLIFFVHVPKTAGSTVNSYLHEWKPNGRSHCEAFMQDEAELRAYAARSDWLSGHVNMNMAGPLLSAATTRQVRFFSCVREPTAQVMSHYNWLIEIFHKGEQFYERHPPAIKAISEKIRSSRTDAASIMDNLDTFGWLFLNVQSAFVLGRGCDSSETGQRLAEYTAITVGDPETLVYRMTGKLVDRKRRENASSYHFDPAVFECNRVRAFLAERNAIDESLFRAICQV